MPTLTKTAAQMVAEARARITEIETPELIAMLDDPDVVEAAHLREGFSTWAQHGGPVAQSQGAGSA